MSRENSKKTNTDYKWQLLFIVVTVIGALLVLPECPFYLKRFCDGPNNQVRYKLEIKTAEHPHAGTDAGRFFFKLIGENGESEQFLLDIPDPIDDRKVGAVDVYRISSPDLGDILELIISSDAKVKGSDGWLMEYAVVTKLDAGGENDKKHKFECSLWIDSDLNGGVLAFRAFETRTKKVCEET